MLLLEGFFFWGGKGYKVEIKKFIFSFCPLLFFFFSLTESRRMVQSLGLAFLLQASLSYLSLYLYCHDTLASVSQTRDAFSSDLATGPCRAQMLRGS